MNMNIQAILQEIRQRREKSYTTKADIQRVAQAMETGNWAQVYASRLYQLHSGEYCELLEIMARHRS